MTTNTHINDDYDSDSKNFESAPITKSVELEGYKEFKGDSTLFIITTTPSIYRSQSLFVSTADHLKSYDKIGQIPQSIILTKEMSQFYWIRTKVGFGLTVRVEMTGSLTITERKPTQSIPMLIASLGGTVSLLGLFGFAPKVMEMFLLQFGCFRRCAMKTMKEERNLFEKDEAQKLEAQLTKQRSEEYVDDLIEESQRESLLHPTNHQKNTYGLNCHDTE